MRKNDLQNGMILDDIDRQILQLMKDDARVSLKSLASHT